MTLHFNCNSDAVAEAHKAHDIRSRAPRIIDLRRIPTLLTGKGKRVDGIFPRSFALPAGTYGDTSIERGLEDVRSELTRRARVPGWKGIAVLVALAASALHFSTVGSTTAYFADLEETRENVLEAGSVDFSLDAIATSSTFSRVNCTPSSSLTETVVVIPATSSNPFRYFPQAEHFSGDSSFCDSITVVAKLSGKKVYEGSLAGLTSAATTTPGTWIFTFTTKKNQSNMSCSFDIVFKGWQTRHNLPSYEHGGFRDLETAHVSLATWGIRINKVYHTVASGKGDDVTNEWIELYNQTNSTVTIGGWRVCDNDSCDTIPAGTKLGAGKFAVVTGDASTFDYWPAPNGVKRIVLSDGAIGNGLDDADMLVLTRSNGTVVDAVNWGLPDVSWSQFTLDSVWNPGIMTTTTHPIFARIPAGLDTNAVSDWKTVLPPTIGLDHPDEAGTYEWVWGHSMNISWHAHNANGADSKLRINLYSIKDKDGNGVISAGDTVGTIVEGTSNDGEYNWSVPWGFSGKVWIRAVAMGPENPMLIDATTSGVVRFKSPVGKNWEKFNKIFDTADGVDLQAFVPGIDLGAYTSPLFTINFPPENDDIDDDENGCAKKCTCSKCGTDTEPDMTPPLFDASGFEDLVEQQIGAALGAVGQGADMSTSELAGSETPEEDVGDADGTASSSPEVAHEFSLPTIPSVPSFTPPVIPSVEIPDVGGRMASTTEMLGDMGGQIPDTFPTDVFGLFPQLKNQIP